jgi:LemA protein
MLQRVFLVISFTLIASSCGLQSIPQAKNKVEAALAETSNQYKRRSDLIPNLVNVVKGYASHEQETLTAVVEARSKASQVSIDPAQMDPKKLQEYMGSQGQLSQALGRLMVVAEKYPDLKADASFRDLSAQIEGTENRITIARQRYIETINVFNDLITVPPTSLTNSLLYHHEKMPQWSVDEQEKKQIETAPKVEFK